MVKSDHSEAEEEEEMSPLQLSDSAEEMTKKRFWQEVSKDQDEQELPAKKRRNSFSEKLEQDNAEVISNKNGTDKYNLKEENYTVSLEKSQNLDEKPLHDSNVNNPTGEKLEVFVKEEIESKNSSENRDPIIDKIKKEKTEDSEEDSPSNESANTNATSTCQDEIIEGKKVIGENDKSVDEEKRNEEDEKKETPAVKNRAVDTEVVGGLELSVECASDKEDSSSENEDEKNTKPRPKTIIIKAKPNESELECSSSEETKIDSQKTTDTVEPKREKKRGRKKRLNISESDDSRNNSDEDYSPRIKKKMKRASPAKRGRKGRGRARRNSYKRNTEDVSDDDNNADTSLVDKTHKATKTKDEEEEELSENESAASGSNINDEDEEKSKGRRKGRRSNAKPEDNKQIQTLKKYLKAAGVKIRCYNELWADCKSNIAKVNRLKELLEKNGVSGRPTLEKCKRAKEKNEKMREVSELDTSNIISEGRITRARRNIDNRKKTSTPDSSPRSRDARHTFKRIQTVVDSDSE